MKQIESATIMARRWNDKNSGTPYHNVTIYVNDEVLRQGETYGHGEQYRETARQLLKNNGYEVPEKYDDFIFMDQICTLVSDKGSKDILKAI